MNKHNNKIKIFSAALFGSIIGGLGMFANTSAIGNSAFTDANFYSCVVKQFDALYPNEVAIAATVSDTVLTDAQLAKMDRLNCEHYEESSNWSLYGRLPSFYAASDPKITSTAGLNKLTGLVTFIFSGHELSAIDLSKNTNLEELMLNHNGLTNVDLSKNIKLKNVVINDALTSFSEPTLVNVTSLNLQGNDLASLDVSNNTKLNNLMLNGGNNKLKEIDLSKNSKLRNLTIDYDNNAFVTPFVEYSQTDDCKLAVKIPITGKDASTIVGGTEYYTYNENTSTLIFKKKPEKNLVNSSYFRTIQTGITQGAIDKIFYIVLPDSVYAEYDKLSSCTPKVALASNTDSSTKDDGSTKDDSNIKVPNTGSAQKEQNAKIISISLVTLGITAFVIYISSYIYKRHKNHVKF